MGYSIKEAIDERQQEVDKALQESDSEKLFQLAELFKEEGDDEEAEVLLATAKRIERDEWAYDEFKEN